MWNKKRHRISPAALLLSEHICRRPSSVPPSTKRAIVLAAQRSGFAEGHSDECAEAFKRLVDDVADAHIALPEVVGEPAITAVGPISTP